MPTQITVEKLPSMKVTIVTAKGTDKREVDVNSQNLPSDELKKINQERLSIIGKNITLSMEKGQRCIPLKDLPAPRNRPSFDGIIIVTERGTATRRITNKGTL